MRKLSKKKLQHPTELEMENKHLKEEIRILKRAIPAGKSPKNEKTPEKSFIVTLQNEISATSPKHAAMLFMNDYILSSIKYGAEIELCVCMEGSEYSHNILVVVDQATLLASIIKTTSCDVAKCECTCHDDINKFSVHCDCDCEYDHCGNCDNGYCLKCPICNCNCDGDEVVIRSENCHCNCSNENCVECDDERRCLKCRKCSCDCDEGES